MRERAAWLRFPQPTDDAHTLVVCVPPTGAHGASFSSWVSRAPTGTALALVDPPGRGLRTDEAPVTDMSEYASAVAAELLRFDHRLVLVGVSLGGVIAYEICRALLAADRDVARLCPVASRPPTAYTGEAGPLTSADARAYVARTGLTEPELLQDTAFEELLLPPVLADLRLAGGYDGRAASPLPVPIRTVRAKDDTRVLESAARDWGRHTDAGWSEHVLDGGHYVHRTHPEQVIHVCLSAVADAQKPSRRSLLGLGVGAVAGTLGSLSIGPAQPPEAAAAAAGSDRAGDRPAQVRAAATAFTVDAADPVALAVAMIRHDTSNPGDGAVTLPYARMLQGIFDDAGATTEIVPTPKADNVHFFARVPAAGPTDKAPLLLLGHSDVVPAVGDPWTVDPFAGEVKDGRLYGRGALDMKGTNAAFVTALVRHLREGARFDREVIFWSDCDEENGPYGVSWLLSQKPGEIVPGVVLTEGGWVLNQPDGTSPMLASLTCSDKRSMLVQIDTGGYATHTSKPYEGQAVIRLARALELLDAYRFRIRPNTLSRGYFDALSRSTRDQAFAAALRDMLEARSQSARNTAGEHALKLSGHPELHNAMMRTTLAFISADAGYYTSIVPGHASAQLRVSFLPHADAPADVLRLLRELVVDHAKLTVIGRTGETEQQTLDRITGYLATPSSTQDTDIFRMWQRAVATTHDGVATTAAQFEAVTSAVPFREQDIPVYGIYPYAVERESLRRMHGTDEYIEAEALRRGTETIYQLLAQLRVSATPSTARAEGRTSHA
ncbi:M20/M25/M40 family metallo-hydrolase [Streptomyces sp. cg40]|uniref:M20/M25/M40 family metallo-hydrolase n=1 Tax=Streptomyces sp. cg40 TaxID=3419764 RepID=UPI003D015CCC